MLSRNAVIWKDNAILVDISQECLRIEKDAINLALVAAQDKIYLGSHFPFNHRFFDITAENDAVSAISNIELWNGSAWDAVARIIDGTKDGTKTLKKSGIVSWVPDKNKVWARENSSEDISDLSSLKIYDMYWLRMTFSADLSSTTRLNYIGHRFCDDEQLYVDYADLNDDTLMRSVGGTGKTSWKEQLVRASEDIIDSLIADDQIYSADQLMDWTVLGGACVHRAANIIYRGLGKDWADERDSSETEFTRSMRRKAFAIDVNNNARLTPAETIQTRRYVRE